MGNRVSRVADELTRLVACRRPVARLAADGEQAYDPVVARLRVQNPYAGFMLDGAEDRMPTVHSCPLGQSAPARAIEG